MRSRLVSASSRLRESRSAVRAAFFHQPVQRPGFANVSKFDMQTDPAEVLAVMQS